MKSAEDGVDIHSKWKKKLVAWALALSIPACVSANLNLISKEEERRLGQEFNAQVHNDMQVIDSREYTDFLYKLGTSMLKPQGIDASEFVFHIVRDAGVNAFAIPGGHIYVNTGLIEAAENESELAGVLAHEIAHVVERHGTEQLTRQLGINAVAALALGGNPGIMQQLAAQVGGTALLLQYGRDAERESDELAVKYTYDAGIDPRGLIRFFEFLAKQEGKTPPRFLAWLQSHPMTQDRIKSVRRLIAQQKPKEVVVDTPAFHAWKEKVIAQIAR